MLWYRSLMQILSAKYVGAAEGTHDRTACFLRADASSVRPAPGASGPANLRLEFLRLGPGLELPMSLSQTTAPPPISLDPHPNAPNQTSCTVNVDPCSAVCRVSFFLCACFCRTLWGGLGRACLPPCRRGGGRIPVAEWSPLGEWDVGWVNSHWAGANGWCVTAFGGLVCVCVCVR